MERLVQGMLLLGFMLGGGGVATAQSFGCPPADTADFVGRVRASEAFRRVQEATLAYWLAYDSAYSVGPPDSAAIRQIVRRQCEEIRVSSAGSVPDLRIAEVLAYPGFVERYAIFAIVADTVFLLNEAKTGRLGDRLDLTAWNAVVARSRGQFHVNTPERAGDYAVWLASLIREFVFPFSCPGSDWRPAVTGESVWTATFEFCRNGKPPAERWLTIEMRESGEVLRMTYK